MGAQLDRLRYEVFQNLFYSPMDTGFLRSAVATVLTAYGIETLIMLGDNCRALRLQQCLPLTVLKPKSFLRQTEPYMKLQQCLPLTVLKQDF